MTRQIPPTIRTPCPKVWQEIHGDSKTRFCDHCQLHVQNLSAMSKREVALTLAHNEKEHVCVTYIRRGDGSLVTRWDGFCDSLLTPLRRGFAWALAACAPIVLSACQTQSQLISRAEPGCTPPSQKKTEAVTERVIVTGGI